MSLFTINCTPVITRLISLIIKGVDEDPTWLEKAIKSLAKKLRKTRQLEDFEKILHTRDPLSKCITITRSLDGRLQIAHRKVLPHVAYCRIFRWPNLHSYHELKSLGNCEFSFQRKKDLLCINPYHYYRAELLIMPPIYVPRMGKMNGSKPISTQPFGDFSLYDLMSPLESKQDKVNLESMRSGLMPISKYNDKRTDYYRPLFTDINMNGLSDSSLYEKPIMAPLSLICGMKTENIIEPIVNLIPSSSPFSFNSSSELNTRNLFENFRINLCDNYLTQDLAHTFNQQQNIDCENVTQIQLEIDKLVIRSILPTLKRHALNNEKGLNSNEDYKIVNYPPCKCWCSISYYEYDKKNGVTYSSNSKIINIDFNSEQLTQNCFGLKLFQLQNTNEEFTRFKSTLGTAIKFIHGGGEVMIECLAKNVAVFVSSSNFNLKNNKPYDSVHRLERGDTMTVFDYHDFAPLLARCIAHSYEAVYRLLSWTIIRVSFIKGWGPNFKRQTPDDTPVWFEIKLIGPMSWLDRIIRQIASPLSKCSSMT